MRTDFAYLTDIADACEAVLERVAGLTLDSFDGDGVVRNAVYYRPLIIGEAAGRVTAETLARMPEVPWAQIRRMRNVLVHDYGGVDVEIVWDVTQNHIRPLLAAVSRVLPPPE